MQYAAITGLCNVFVVLGGGFGLLLKAVQNVNGLFKFGDIQHTVNALGILDADFFDTRTNIIKWFPVVGLQASLVFAQLEAGFLLGLKRKCTKVSE